MAYDINYNDNRFTKVESDKDVALKEAEETYDSMINNSDKFYQEQIDASKEYADTQSKLQQEQTNFAIEQIEQQKEQAQKDYTKEQQGAYVDWQKQKNQYGVNAEQMAAQGLTNTGYSESSQVAMYTAYQNRVAMAKESLDKAILNYNNGITEARLQNNSALAEIKFQALQQQLELSLQGFQYKNTLVLAKADKKSEIENTYYARYQDVLAQINHENALAEQVRQYNESLALQKAQLAEEKRQFDIKNSSVGALKGSNAVYINKGGTDGNGKTKTTNIKKRTVDEKRMQVNNKQGKSSDPTIDKESLAKVSAFYGITDASRLNELIKQGVIVETVKDGKLVYSGTDKIDVLYRRG